MTQTGAITKTVVVTGASSGIGEATARAFAALGWRVAIGARRIDVLENLAKDLKFAGAKDVLVSPLDVGQTSSVKFFAAKSLEFAQGKVDALINNAGLAKGVDKVFEGNEDDWQSMMDTNVMGVLRVTREFVPAMIKAQCGHIINVGSIAGFLVYEGGSVYCASKHAVRAITKTLRLELNGTPLRVTSIDPGMVETDFSKVRFSGDANRAKSVYAGVKPLTGTDIADCIVWSALRPAHVNIDEIVVMPVDQAAPHKVNRKTT